MQPLRVSPSEIAAHRPPPAAPRDPAPSRLTYKAHRLWLTPLFRSMMLVGVPAFLAISLVGGFVADPDNRAAIAARIAKPPPSGRRPVTGSASRSSAITSAA